MESGIDRISVTNALRSTSKGQLQYNRDWNQPNRQVSSRGNERRDYRYTYPCYESSPGYSGQFPHIYYSTPQHKQQDMCFPPNLGSPIARLSPTNQSPREHMMDGSFYTTAYQSPVIPSGMMGMPMRRATSDGDSNESSEEEDSDSDSVGRAVTPYDSVGRELSPSESPEADIYDAGNFAEENVSASKSDKSSREGKLARVHEGEQFCRTFEAEKSMYEYDVKRKMEVMNKVSSQKRFSEEKTKLVYLETERKSHAASETKHQANLQIQEALRLEQEKEKRESQRRRESDKERYKERDRTMQLRAQLLDQEEKRKELERQEKRRMTQKMLDQILEYEGSLSRTISRILVLLGKPGIASKASVYSTKVRECTEGIQQIIARFKTRLPEQQDVLKAEAWYQQSVEVEKQLIALVEGESQAEAEKQKEASLSVRSGEEVVADCAYHNSLARFEELEEKRSKFETTLTELKSNADFKALKFQLQKAVNIPLNTVTDVSVEHLKEKVTKLSSLLAGDSVTIGKEKPVSTNQHPQARTFVLNLLAMKIVKKAESEVASKAGAAFPLAAVVVALWGKFPEFGELFLAHLYKACPFLVPYYVPQQEGQSEEEHYRALGYTYSEDGTIEQQDFYLRKMGGVARLYAAVAQTRPIGGKQPFYINRVWEWLSQILNLGPRPDITATMLFEILSICGWLLGASYKSQFKKVLHIVCAEFFPKMKNVTPDDMMGPVTRLQGFLEKAVKEGQIAPPAGKLGPQFDNIA